MIDRELSGEELRAALAAADRGMRLPYGIIAIAMLITTAAITGIQRLADWSNPTHVLIICAAAFLLGQMYFIAALIAARQNAANARMLRALELLEGRLAATR